MRGPARRWRPVAFLLMFAGALAVRLAEPSPSTIIAERQYRSALIARTLYFEATEVPEWRRRVARAAVAHKFALEPPLLEVAVAGLYRLRGGETMWIPRLLSTAFWLFGGYCLLRVARRFTTMPVAGLVTAYYLLVPIGVLASTAFLPDPLMISLFLVALLSVLRHRESPTGPRLAAAAVASAAAILIKPLCLFALVGATVALALHDRRSGEPPRWAQVAILLGFSLLVGTSYYANGMFLDDYMREQADNSFVSRVYLDARYWGGWILNAAWAVGPVPLVIGVLGAGLTRGRLQALVLGLWAGYAAFGLVFAYHVHVSAHYHLQLIPIVALSALPVLDRLRELVADGLETRMGRVSVAAGACLVAALYAATVRYAFRNDGGLEGPEVASRIGELVGHSTRVAFVSYYYGAPLEYVGEMAGVEWRRPMRQRAFRAAGEGPRSIAERLRELKMTPEFFVITDLVEYAAHHDDLRLFLEDSCALVDRQTEYLVYYTDRCVTDLLQREHPPAAPSRDAVLDLPAAGVSNGPVTEMPRGPGPQAGDVALYGARSRCRSKMMYASVSTCLG